MEASILLSDLFLYVLQLKCRMSLTIESYHVFEHDKSWCVFSLSFKWLLDELILEYSPKFNPNCWNHVKDEYEYDTISIFHKLDFSTVRLSDMKQKS